MGGPDNGYPHNPPGMPMMPFRPGMHPRMGPHMPPAHPEPDSVMMGPPQNPMGGFGMYGPRDSGDYGFGFDTFGGFGGGDFAGPSPDVHRKYHKSGGWGGRGPGRGGGGHLGKSRADGNDYNQHFVDTGQRPQNYLRDSQLEDQYVDYPNAKRLVMLKVS